MANLTFAKNSLPCSPLKTCYKSEFITPFVPSLIPVPPIRLQKRWTKKPEAWGLSWDLLLVAIYLWKLLPNIPGEGVRGVGCLCWNVPSLPYAEKCWCLAGVGHRGALHLPPCALCSKGCISTHGQGLSPGGSRYLCFYSFGKGSSCFRKVPAGIKLCFDWEYSNIRLNAYS